MVLKLQKVLVVLRRYVSHCNFQRPVVLITAPPVQMGRIIAKDKMPSCKFKFPKNGALIPTNETFTVQLAVRNFEV
jgi:hypothetical protein